jgi:hypothetical protein
MPIVRSIECVLYVECVLFIAFDIQCVGGAQGYRYQGFVLSIECVRSRE